MNSDSDKLDVLAASNAQKPSLTKANLADKKSSQQSFVQKSDSPVQNMRQDLRNSLSKPKDKNQTDIIKGISFPYALAKIASNWLGASTPTNQSLSARFGNNPSEEAIFALASELGADIKIHKMRPKDLISLPTPFIAELKDGSAIVVISMNKQISTIIANSGKNKISLQHLISIVSGNWISAYQSLSKNSNSLPNNQSQTPARVIISHKDRLKQLASLCFKNNPKDLVRLFVAAILSNSLLVTLPIFITIVYDRVVPHGAFETLTALTIGVILALSIDIGLRAVRVNLQESIGVKAALRLQAAAYRKLVSIPLEVGQKAAKGFLTMLPELDSAALLTPAIITGILADLPFVIIMLGLVYFLTGPVVIVPIIGILIIGLTVFTSNKRALKTAEDVYSAKIELQDQAIETCSTLATTKATRSEHILLNQWSRRTDNSAYLNHKTRQTMAISQQLVLNITQMTIVLTIVAGAVQVNAGAMTLGNLAAATLLVGRIISPVSQLIAQLGQFSTMRASIDNIFSLLDEKEEFGGDENASFTKNFKGNISFNKVNFSYNGAQRQSLSDINLTIKQGEKVGIIGRNGCGKSTLLKMIPRFYLPSSGTIMIDGVDSGQFSPFLLRQSIGYMSQETVLRNDSIRANICAGAGDISEADFERAAFLSGVSNFTKNHPQGYNLNAGPRGEHLSGGERQAVGLARAILQNPNMLILDEPTSAMDNSAEDRLIKELPEYLKDRTVIIATHRMQLLQLVDRIIWMDNSRIVADGPKDEVLSSLRKKAS